MILPNLKSHDSNFFLHLIPSYFWISCKDPGWASVLCIIFEATTKQGSAQECSVNITSTSGFTLGKIHLKLVANLLSHTPFEVVCKCGNQIEQITQFYTQTENCTQFCPMCSLLRSVSKTESHTEVKEAHRTHLVINLKM